MLAARQKAGHIARRLPRAVRNYASEAQSQHHHHHHHPATGDGNESFGRGSLSILASFFGCVLLYQFAPKEGEESTIRNWMMQYAQYRKKVEEADELEARQTRIVEQIAYDRNLVGNMAPKIKNVELAYPESLESYGPRNIRAGQLMNLDHIVEHYRQKYFEEEELKAKKLAAQKE
ncbi:hypothetical protein E4U33_002477 [Claviceps sp. LM78 group G4]|nr:hypothetical protein E4U33_002477 [Claviceps sp. LM78 group G4]